MSIQQYTISELPAEAPMSIYAGDDVEIPFVLEEGEAPNYTPINIAGFEFTLRIEKTRDSSDALVLTTTGGGIPITSGSGGAGKIVFTRTQSAALDITEPLRYDFFYIDTNNKKKTLNGGVFKAVKRKAS
jgi:hypothetical protein